MLADALRAEELPPGAAVLDVCTGSGALAITAAQAGAAHVSAVDVSRRSVLTVRLNARLNGVRVRALRGDLLEPVKGERFHAIVSNPPYVPALDDELPRRGARRAWDAGRTGRVLLDRLIDQAPEHLHGGGVLLVTQSSIVGGERTIARMEGAGLRAQVVRSERSPLGPLMSERVRLLEQRGLLEPGQREEDVLVIRGCLPRTSTFRLAERPGLVANP